MTTVSVALATYNGARYLPEQLASLAAQSSLPDELVVRDDGSTDETLKVLDDFAAVAPFPVHIERAGIRLGFQRNFLRCAELCRSEYVSFCDQDDIWSPDKIEKVKARIEASGARLVFHNATVFNEAGDLGPLYRQTPESIAPQGTAFFLFAPWGFTATFRRDFLQWTSYHTSSRDPYKYGHLEAHDQWVHFLATLSGAIEYIPDALARYRQHGGNLVGTPHKRQRLPIFGNMAASVQRQAALWDCARRRLAILEAMRVANDAVHLPLLEERLRTYRKVVAILAKRKTVYTARAWHRRVRAIGDLLRAGAYTSRGARALGHKGLAKDLLVGLPFASMLRRPR